MKTIEYCKKPEKTHMRVVFYRSTPTSTTGPPV